MRFFFKALICSLSLAAAVFGVKAEHYVVYHHDRDFAGWPANEGLWRWENEILVGFEVARFSETDGDHNVDRNSPKRIVFARSTDGGKNWKTEYHSEIAPPAYIGDEEKYQQKSPDVKDPVVSPGGFDFTDPDFTMKLRGKDFYTSGDRGRTWNGPYILPEFGYISEARTSYIVTGKESCLLFMTGRVSNEGLSYARSCVLETTDAGRTFRFVSWIGEDIVRSIKTEAERENGTLFSSMPSVVQLGEGHYVCALRQRVHRRKWTDVYESRDNGKTWSHLSELERGSSNPAALVVMKDGRIAAVYGNRRQMPCGVAAKISSDGGRTWGEEVVLRDDARKWDLGYARATVLPDGDVLAVYYYTTEALPENFIGATVWQPGRSGENEAAEENGKDRRE